MVSDFASPRGAQETGPIPHLTILGIGRLGRALAAWALHQGLRVVAVPRLKEHESTARDAIKGSWQLLHRHLDPDAPHPEFPWSRLTVTADWKEALPGTRWIFEAIPEDLESKATLWNQLQKSVDEATTLITGTSSLPPERILPAGQLRALHVFLPLRPKAVCEIPVVGEDRVTGSLMNLVEALDLYPIPVQARPGFVGTRLSILQGLEAMRMLDERVVSNPRDLDLLMTQGYGHTIGPLELSDRVGLDVRLGIARSLFELTGDPAFAPPQGLLDRVAKGMLGKKTGQGYFPWPKE